MEESPFGFEYSWEDLQPVRALAITVLVAQFVGAGLGWAVAAYSEWFLNLWVGAAFATLPGYVVGLLIQHIADPEALGDNHVMVTRIGLVAAVLSLMGFFAPSLVGHAG